MKVKKIWLLRHGHAEQAVGGDDHGRPLSTEGRKRIEIVARNVEKVCNPDLVICSTAKRTRQTADIFLKFISSYGKVTYSTDVYEATSQKLLHLINDGGENINSILMVGHNPGISQLVDLLSGQSFNNLSPGDLAELEFTDLKWEEVSANTAILRSR